MLRYYMTPETRQSLIEESNRMIAMRAAINAVRRARAAAERTVLRGASAQADAEDRDEADAVSESAFARLVSELEASSRPPASESGPG